MAGTNLVLDSTQERPHILGNVNGSQVRTLRKIHGLTQQELAVMLDVPRSTVSKWETGTYSMTLRDSLAIVAVINAYKEKRQIQRSA